MNIEIVSSQESTFRKINLLSSFKLCCQCKRQFWLWILLVKWTCLQELRRRKSSWLWQLRMLCLQLFNWPRSSSSELLLWALTTQKHRSVLTQTNDSRFEEITLTVVRPCLHYPFFQQNCVACTLSVFSESTSVFDSKSDNTEKKLKLQIEENSYWVLTVWTLTQEITCFLSPSW